MGLEELKRWHWAVIGALAGIAVGFVVASNGENTEQMQSSDASDFERDVIFQDSKSQLPLISGIVVHPVQFSQPLRANVNLVTYKRLGIDKQGRYGWKDKYFVARIPFVPTARRNIPADAKTTIQTYLPELAKQYNFIDYHYGWWLVPANAMLAGGIGGLLLMGGIWPVLLNLMLGAGLGHASEDGVGVGGAFSLWKYKPRERASKSASSRRAMTEAEQRRLEHVADTYERSMASAVSTAGAASQSAVKAAPPAIQKLNMQGDESKSQGPEDDDEIELKNKEYYPVIIHHHKHHDDQHSADKQPPKH